MRARRSGNGPAQPMLLYGGAVFVIWRYPLDAERLDRLRAALGRRQQRRTARMATDDRRDAVMATGPGPLRRDA